MRIAEGSVKPSPGRNAAHKPAAQETDAKARLARGRPRQELRERDEIREALFGEPMAPLNELGAKITEMRDRAAKRSEAQPEEDAKDFAESARRRRSGFVDAAEGRALVIDLHQFQLIATHRDQFRATARARIRASATKR